jgi:hypothetical protein
LLRIVILLAVNRAKNDVTNYAWRNSCKLAANSQRTVVVPSTNRSADPGEQKPIYLERLPLELTIELPVGSKAGAYELQLKMNDRAVVSTGGTADIQHGTTAFAARLNLSQFEPGSYSMVIRQVPLDWNLYPIVIR